MSVALSIEGLVAGYGETVVIDDLSLNVESGESLAVLGRNGVGKTTLLSSIMGMTRRHAGRVLLHGKPIERVAIHERARRGIGLVPQEREIFKSLTVLENLQVSMRPQGWDIEQVFALFPSLATRQANTGNRLSGGEQQMLAVARALVGAPSLLLLDEPMEGLAPIVVETLFAALERIRDESGLTIVLVEQKAELALRFAQRCIVLERGRIVHQGPCSNLLNDETALSRMLGLAHAEAP